MRLWQCAVLLLVVATISFGCAAAAKRVVAESAPAGYGCPLYADDDWFTTDTLAGKSRYVSSAVDPRSAKIIGNLKEAYPRADFSANVDPSLVAVNIVSANAPTTRVQGLAYGFNNDPYNDDPPPYRIPVADRLLQEGSNGCDKGDCHVVVLDRASCVVWETYNWDAPSWNGTSYTAKAGFVHSLHHPYNDQYAQNTVGPTAAHTPLYGTTDWGEESSLQKIRHVLGFFLGMPGLAAGGHVPPATGGASCRFYCANALPYGARLRLHSNFPCPERSKYPQASLICVQMKSYGIMFDDTTGMRNGFGVRLGASADGSDPWNPSDYNQLLRRLSITDFDVLTLGVVQ